MISNIGASQRYNEQGNSNNNSLNLSQSLIRRMRFIYILESKKLNILVVDWKAFKSIEDKLEALKGNDIAYFR